METTRKANKVRVEATIKSKKQIKNGSTASSQGDDEGRSSASSDLPALQLIEDVDELSAEDARAGISVTPIELLPTESLKQQAMAWDRRINEIPTSLVVQTLELSSALAKMKETQGYRELGFKSWEDYLKSKRHGRTMLSYLLKLGQAGDLSWVAERDITPTILTTYAEKASPKQIPSLIEATIDQVEGRSVKDAKKAIVGYLADHADEFPATRRKKERTVLSEAVPQTTATRTAAAPRDWVEEFKSKLIEEYGEQVKADNRARTKERGPAFLLAMKVVVSDIESEEDES